MGKPLFLILRLVGEKGGGGGVKAYLGLNDLEWAGPFWVLMMVVVVVAVVIVVLCLGF